MLRPRREPTEVRADAGAGLPQSPARDYVPLRHRAVQPAPTIQTATRT